MIQLKRLIPPPAGTRTRIAVVGAVALALALTAASTTPAVLTPHGVLVLDGKSQVVATFRTAKCTAKLRGVFHALARSGVWKLDVFIRGGFSGFHDYLIVLSANAIVEVYLDKPGPYTYSNLNVPAYPSPGQGRLTFAKRGTLMGVGFSPMYGEDLEDAVTVTGVLTCTYPKKPRR